MSLFSLSLLSISNSFLNSVTFPIFFFAQYAEKQQIPLLSKETVKESITRSIPPAVGEIL